MIHGFRQNRNGFLIDKNIFVIQNISYAQRLGVDNFGFHQVAAGAEKIFALRR